jgi:20S proteasome alpha/beta subunit
MPLRAIARLIQTMLYGKRFFPYYVYNILGGIEEDGQWRHLFLTLRLRPVISISPSIVDRWVV